MQTGRGLSINVKAASSLHGSVPSSQGYHYTPDGRSIIWEHVNRDIGDPRDTPLFNISCAASSKTFVEYTGGGQYQSFYFSPGYSYKISNLEEHRPSGTVNRSYLW